MQPDTHPNIDSELCGTLRELSDGQAVVELRTIARMAADDRGLVHGGFVFGLADYAAMLSINHPNVVLGAAETRFVAPVVVGDTLVATAVAQPAEGKKLPVEVVVLRGEDRVFQGRFICFTPGEHVLGGGQ